MSDHTAWVETPLHLDADGVWVRSDVKPFDYSDGDESEKYLEKVLRSAHDLGSNSAELASHIKDWPSEYHLTPKRAQLLRGFDFDPGKSVLEVGCGCGAITRFLGETFNQVLAVDGSHARARLARLRTRDLSHVDIVQSPFQELRFTTKFDLVFCTGVFEYASMFASGDDPHEALLQDLADLLAPGGVLVLAIENKFGLKYFSSSSEDHTGVMFDGVEGYPRFERKARTFGRAELADRLGRQFENVEFYYPFPDYKIPSCVLTEDMLARVDPSELIGSFTSVDYGNRRRRPLFDEALAWKELAANRMVPTMAHSFLAVGSKSPDSGLRFEGLGRLYSNRRRAEFSTLTRFHDAEDGGLWVTKSRTAGGAEFVEGKLRHRAWSGAWHAGSSLQHTMARRARARDLDLSSMLAPSRVWFDELVRSANGGPNVPGDRLDCIWRNCFVVGDACDYIDREWEWLEPLPLWLVVARCLYDFTQTLIDAPSLSPLIKRWRVDQFVVAAAACYGVRLDDTAMRNLARFEAAFLSQVEGSGKVTEDDVAAVLRRRLNPRGAQRLSGLPRRGLAWLERRVRRLRRVRRG
jgi:SAM-dependent methyltransferase